MRALGERAIFWLCVAVVCASALAATGVQSRRHLALAAAGPRADQLVNEGRFADAEALLRRGLRADPGSFDLLDRLADVMLMHGRRRESLELRRRALACNPYTPEAYRALADTYDALRRDGEAARIMERYLALWPDDAGALHLFAYCCERAGRPRRALEAWRRLLRVEPHHLSAQRGVARVTLRLAREGDREPAHRMGASATDSGARRPPDLSDPACWM